LASQIIPNLPPAIALTGLELIWIVQAGVDKRVPVGAISVSISPAAMAALMALLPPDELQPLALALLASLPVQTGAGAPVPTGQPFINTSGFVVIAQ
jgi:hypothetical protein